MIGLAPYLQVIWACAVLAQLTVLVLLFRGRYFLRLPLFASYVGLNICQQCFLFIVYRHFSFTSRTSLRLFWISEIVTLLARTLATIELLRRVLRLYRGIWALSWRLLAAASVGIFGYAAIDAGRDMPWAIVLADRGYHLAFAAALIGFLWLVRYYSISIEPVYKVLLGGFCFYSCALVFRNTVLQFLFLRGSPSYQEVWNAMSMIPFLAANLAWAIALRDPALADERRPILLPGAVYGQISPEINLRLRLLNEQLSRFWKVEA